MLSAEAVEGLPEVSRGTDLAGMIVRSLHDRHPRRRLADDDVLVVAHKVISKTEGRTRSLEEVTPSRRAFELGATVDKDPRHVQVILDESDQVIRAVPGVLICVTRQGFVCANAGVDASNVPGEGQVVLLPVDPDGSARRLRARIRELTGVSPAILVTDSFGRAWRHGQSDVAIGCAGIAPLEDWRGRPDVQGRELTATLIAVADELAAAADLARAKDLAQPVVRVRGAGRHVTAEDGPGARALIRPQSEDLFR